MRVVPPITINDARLTSSTVAEPSAGESVYNSSTVYITGSEVISTTTHKKYTSLQGSQSTVTVTIGAPAVFTWVQHGMLSGASVVLSTTGALPTGFAVGTTYYSIVTGVDTFNLSATAGGTAITSSGSQSGTHTAKSAVNVGNPLPVLPLTQTAWWKESGATNKYAAFDLARNTQSTGASPMVFVVTPGLRVNSVGVLGMVADHITIQGNAPSQITASNPTGLIYSNTTDLTIREVRDLYEYAFTPFAYSPSKVIFDMPPLSDMVVTIIVSSTSGTVSVGSVVLGTYTYLGATQYSAESDWKSFASVTRDFDGTATLVPRRAIPQTNQTLRVAKERTREIAALREKLDTVPALWSALDDAADPYFEMLEILGIFNRFTINAADPGKATITLQLEEI